MYISIQIVKRRSHTQLIQLALQRNIIYLFHGTKVDISKALMVQIDFHIVLGDPEVTANTYCKSRNLPHTDTQNYSTDLR